MKDIDRAMKYFIAFSLGSAAVLPLMSEMYANVSRTIAMVLLAAWAVWAGVKFSALPTKSAMLGITAYVFSSVILSLVGYVIIHPAVRKWIEDHSVYFTLSIAEYARYWCEAFALLLLAYVVFFARLGLAKARGKLSDNSRDSASAIENAFSEDEP